MPSGTSTDNSCPAASSAAWSVRTRDAARRRPHRQGARARRDDRPAPHVCAAVDVVGAAVHLAENQKFEGPFNIADEQPISVQGLAEGVMHSLGMTPSRIRVPGASLGLARLGKGLAGLLMRPLNARTQNAWTQLCHRQNLAPKLSPRVDIDWLDFLSHNNTFDITRLRKSGYTFVHGSIDTGIPHTTQWYRTHRWLPPAH